MRKNNLKYIKKNSFGNVAIICYEEDIEAFKLAIPDASYYSFGRKNDTAGQAHVLFSILRDADKRGHDAIFAPLPSTDGVGLALYNRMIRAAAHTVIDLKN